MELYFKRMEKIVGTFVLCIILLLLAVVISIGRGKDWFQRYITYYSMFEESYNLETNTPVKLFKADIGKVKKITLVGDKVKVQLAIREEYAYRIRSDSFAIVESPTLIGSEYVSIRPGNPDLPQIPNGGMIPAKAKRSVSDVIAEFELEKTAKMLIRAVQDLSDLALTLRDPKGPLFATLGHLEQTTGHIEKITRDVQEGKGTLGSLLKSRELIESIQSELDTVGKVLKHVEVASEKAPDAMVQVQDGIASVKEVIDGVNQSVGRIKGLLGKVDETLDTIRVIVDNIERGSEDIPQITQSAKGGIQEVRDGLENIDRVVQSLQQNILIRSHLPPEPEGDTSDAGLRR